jgi:hypothetical protein
MKEGLARGLRDMPAGMPHRWFVRESALRRRFLSGRKKMYVLPCLME